MSNWRWDKKQIVEECKSISTAFLRDHGYFGGSGTRYGGCRWTNSNGEETGNIGYEVSTWDHVGNIRFRYSKTDRDSDEKQSLDYTAELVSTPCFFGGRRWWLLCPIVKNGTVCARRVGKLYLGGGKYFGCRHCYNLTYISCQEHDSRVDRLLRNPDLLREMLNQKGGLPSLLAIKAAIKKNGGL